MRWFKTFIFAGCLLLLGNILAPHARGDEWDKATRMTFNAPVELPGMVLEPGTYLFRLLDSPSDRNIVQVFSADRTKLYDTILASPDYRLQPTGKTVMTFEERAAGSPEAVRAWFYPGDEYGLEFVYPKPRAVQLAQAAQHPVPAMPVAVAKAAPAQLKKAPVTAVQPSGQEVPLAEVHPPAPPAPVQTAAAPVKKLPKTASPMPLIALIGMLASSGGIALRFLSKRVG